jgi:hypothetical protein
MEHVESKEIPGTSQALVDRYGAAALRRLFDPRGEPNYWLYWDRSVARDGSDISGPFPAARHAETAKKGWLAVGLVEEAMDGRTGGKWKEVESLPDTLMVAGEGA